MSITSDDILKMKESKFEEYVEFASKSYGLKYKPRVVFQDGRIPDMPKVNACIELSSQTIFVSRAYLINATDDDIKETAFHEVTHLFNASHDGYFHEKLGDAITGTWKPPSGVIAIDGGIRRDKPSKKPKHEIDKVHCNRCGKKIKLTKCKYCDNYFCSDHINAITPSMPNFKDPNWERIKGENHHPCPDYPTYLAKKEKERTVKYKESLDRMSEKGRFKQEYYPKEKTIQPIKNIKKKNKQKDWIDQETKIKVKKCSFCFKKDDENLKKCEYCNEWFCKEHIEPGNMHELLSNKGVHDCKQYEENLKKTKSEKESEDLIGDKHIHIEEKKDNQSIWKRLKNKFL